jgi:hypothetical protein
MAVSDEFREQWLECQEEYGKNIEAGDIPVLELDRIDESISLPAVKFTAPFNPNIDNQFDSYVHVPMATFKKPIDDLAAQVSQATSDLVDLKQRTEQARQDAIAATDEASNVDADLTGMTVTITNRKGVSKEVNIGFEILERNVYPSIAAMNANAAYVRAGEFCMIATTDPTSPENAQLWSRNSSPSTSAHPFTFLSDLDQAATSAFSDWLENYKPVIEADHTRAEQDHSTATSDHQTATRDHQTATQDHSISAQQQATFETNEAARQQTFDTDEANRQQTFDTNEAQRQADFENAEEDRIAAMTVTRCFVRLQNMHLIFVQPESDSTQYKVRRGRLKIITTYNT